MEHKDETAQEETKDPGKVLMRVNENVGGVLEAVEGRDE